MTSMRLLVREFLATESRSPFRNWPETLTSLSERAFGRECSDLRVATSETTKTWAREFSKPVWILGRDTESTSAAKEGESFSCSQVATNHPKPAIFALPGAIGRSAWRRRSMARRSRDWNEQLARDLQDPAFAKEFLLAALEEGVPLQQALGKIVRASGVREFSRKIRMASPNILRAIDPRHNPSPETLNRLLEPLGLKLGLTVLDKSSEHAA
jgi:DNA-binding phage protein